MALIRFRRGGDRSGHSHGNEARSYDGIFSDETGGCISGIGVDGAGCDSSFRTVAVCAGGVVAVNTKGWLRPDAVSRSSVP